MYSIGQVAEMFHLPISTLRYYDKEGLFPNLERVSGIRRFRDEDLETLRIIECLKQSGLEIKEIKYFIELCSQGKDSYPARRALFEERKQETEKELVHIQKTLAMLQYKCWYYDQAIKDGNETNIRAMLPDHLPEDIQRLYDFARS